MQAEFQQRQKLWLTFYQFGGFSIISINQNNNNKYVSLNTQKQKPRKKTSHKHTFMH